jgi:hypothetical protein
MYFTPAPRKSNASAGDFLCIPLTEFILAENDKLENARTCSRRMGVGLKKSMNVFSFN